MKIKYLSNLARETGTGFILTIHTEFLLLRCSILLRVKMVKEITDKSYTRKETKGKVENKVGGGEGEGN